MHFDNYLDLFSGIGGWHLGASMASWSFSNVFNSDICEYANAIYQQHFPDTINLGSITGIDGHQLRAQHPGEWIVSGSFPCQDLSCHNSQGAGLDGARSGLWFEMLRVCAEIRPKYIIAENVAVLRSRGLNRVLHGLASIGYDAEWQVIPGYYVGSPQVRERLWLVSYPHSASDARCVFDQYPQGHHMADSHQPSIEAGGPDLWFDWQREVAVLLSSGHAVVRRKTYGVSGRMDDETRVIDSRGKALGNAIIPQIAEYIWRRIAVREAGG